MKKTPKTNPKALKTAKEWLRPALLYAIFDCSDSSHDAEALENRFNAFVDDKISIEDFVKKYLYDEYLEAIVDAVTECGVLDEWRDHLENGTPGELPIPFEQIKTDLEKLIDE